jgi:hypothetical protein
MFEHARKYNHKFKAAFDCLWPEHNKAAKMFGSYASWEDFRDDLLEAKPENRHFSTRSFPLKSLPSSTWMSSG